MNGRSSADTLDVGSLFRGDMTVDATRRCTSIIERMNVKVAGASSLVWMRCTYIVRDFQLTSGSSLNQVSFSPAQCGAKMVFRVNDRMGLSMSLAPKGRACCSHIRLTITRLRWCFEIKSVLYLDPTSTATDGWNKIVEILAFLPRDCCL
jgi:hypothetical protein